jgi:hypothetical protein
LASLIKPVAIMGSYSVWAVNSFESLQNHWLRNSGANFSG